MEKQLKELQATVHQKTNLGATRFNQGQSQTKQPIKCIAVGAIDAYDVVQIYHNPTSPQCPFVAKYSYTTHRNQIGTIGVAMVTAADGDTYWLDDITVGDSIKLGKYADDESGDSCDTFTYTTQQFDDIKWGDLFESSPEIKVGDKVLTSDMVEKLGALIDMIEGLDDDNALKQLFDTQLGMNKIRGDND